MLKKSHPIYMNLYDKDRSRRKSWVYHSYTFPPKAVAMPWCPRQTPNIGISAFNMIELQIPKSWVKKVGFEEIEDEENRETKKKKKISWVAYFFYIFKTHLLLIFDQYNTRIYVRHIYNYLYSIWSTRTRRNNNVIKMG